ncbi:MAG: sugar transferase, partial [Pseudomonadota bacterium]|nr:sugar transferase [Pseudomonadota bacterium]
IVADGQGDNPVFSKTKRFIDLAFALSIIVLLWWAMVIIWVTIRLQSPGPGIFRQERVGRNEQVFTCLKFRTMYLSAPNVGTHEVPAAAVTPLGHFLRRTKLDELPQVINILRNEMSLVGPRPCLPNQASMILERRAQGVFEIKPGITGLAQVRGIDMSDPAGLAACDREYLQLQSLLLDVKIILQTARGAGSGDNVATVQTDADDDRP